ncbi:uncharacterized protein EV420DRAFT_1581758 [Desarmillaria tabescens]|uniref:Uncharacterized protein n=1 Tax=Armillaria tabescens TaxID=1929756 RepID=A0AA39MNY0_ARMTA|nr:uncharacterized protein EV420DRAFT_1581758 [Desarmillaria tabescens]KAK0440390.1 hypothetical protein EV420DRAFT_1581758 [Desarmillaria tabescens]
MTKSSTGAPVNPGSGPIGTINPKSLPKSSEDITLDKLWAKMSKEVAMRNMKRADRRKELMVQGKDPKDVSDDKKDESDVLIHTVRKAVEAKAASASLVKAAATIASSTTTATSMDATLSTFFSDAMTEKNKTAYNPNDIAFYEDYKALLVYKISIPLSMFHPSYLHALQSDGTSKNFSVLNISRAPAEADLNRADFLMCYNNLLEFFTDIGYFWVKFFKDPFIPDPSAKSWSDGVQTAKDNYLLRQRETQFNPYDMTQRDNASRSSSFQPLCLRCGLIGHYVDSCMAATPSKSGRFFLVEWRDNSLLQISDHKLVCVHFNLTVCRIEPSINHVYNLLDKYPNLVFDIAYSSPIAEANPEIIENYLQDEIAAGRMGEGLSVEKAHVFFGGHFRTAPMGVVFDQQKPWIIHNLSAQDPEGSSTNSWLNAKDWLTRWYTASMYEEAVSV